MDNSSCKTCSSYHLKKMITCGQPYGYYGEIPCLRCIRYDSKEDLHTHNNNQNISLYRDCEDK